VKGVCRDVTEGAFFVLSWKNRLTCISQGLKAVQSNSGDLNPGLSETKKRKHWTLHCCG